MKTPLTQKFTKALIQINSPAIRKIIKKEFPNDNDAVKIAVVVEKILNKTIEGFNKTLDQKAGEVMQHMNWCLGITNGKLTNVENRLNAVEGRLGSIEEKLDKLLGK